jgi:translation elongation factor EF-Ts
MILTEPETVSGQQPNREIAMHVAASQPAAADQWILALFAGSG